MKIILFLVSVNSQILQMTESAPAPAPTFRQIQQIRVACGGRAGGHQHNGHHERNKTIADFRLTDHMISKAENAFLPGSKQRLRWLSSIETSA